MPKLTEELKKTGKEFVDQATSHVHSAVASAKGIAERFGLTEQPQSLDDTAGTIMSHLNAGRYKEAGQHLGHQIMLGIRAAHLDERMADLAGKAQKFLEDLQDNPQKTIADGFRTIGEKCSKVDNKFIKAIGDVFKGIAVMIEHPEKALTAISEMVEKGVNRICETARGILGGKEVHAR